MKNPNAAGAGIRLAAKRALCAVITLCMAATVMPARGALATSLTQASAITPSAVKVYARLTGNVNAFRTDTMSTAAAVLPAGSVLQLVANATYASGGVTYASLYYQNERFNVVYADISAGIMSEADLLTYITGTLWKQTSFTSINKESGALGSVATHGLQLALRTLGFYNGALDGNFGSGTLSAVRNFQRAHHLEVDGRAGALTQGKLYPLALSAYGSGGTGTGTGTGTGAPASAGTLKTTASVNLRTSTSTKSARLAIVPRGVSLSYTNAVTTDGVTWYNVVYNGLNGWLMGTFVSATGSAGTGTGTGATPAQTGTVTITEKNTRVRKTPNGTKTGILLPAGTVLPLLGNPVTQGGYSWYYVKTTTGVLGYVRGDCATVNTSHVAPSSTKTYIMLPAAITVYSSSGNAINVEAGRVLQLVSTATFNTNGVEYYSVYVDNVSYSVPKAAVSAYIMSDPALVTYITGTLWRQTSFTSLKSELGLIGDVRVHGLQLALNVLGYYTGTLDGNFGSGTQAAVKNFQRAGKLDVDGRAGPVTQAKLYELAIKSFTGGGGTGGTPIADAAAHVGVTGMAGYLRTNASNVPVYSDMGSNIAITLISSGSILYLKSAATVSNGGVEYYQVGLLDNATYYVRRDMVTSLDYTLYLSYFNTLTSGTQYTAYTYTLKKGDKNANVTAAQRALQMRGCYFGKIDGSFGDGTYAAVALLQKACALTQDGVAGHTTLCKIFGTALTTGTGTGTGTGTPVPAGDFGAVNSVETSDWYTGDVATVFARGTVAKMMDCATGRVLTVKRSSGGYHADVEPLTSADTQVLCAIYGVTYPTGSPSSSTLNAIRDNGKTQTAWWPEITPSKNWQRRAVLVNVNGRVFCGSLYGVPHNYPDGDTISGNNLYGQICIHFTNSRTHGTDRVDSLHQAAIQQAYQDARNRFGSSVMR